MKTTNNRHRNGRKLNQPDASPSITLKTRQSTQRLTRSAAKQKKSAYLFHSLPAIQTNKTKQQPSAKKKQPPTRQLQVAAMPPSTVTNLHPTGEAIDDDDDGKSSPDEFSTGTTASNSRNIVATSSKCIDDNSVTNNSCLQEPEGIHANSAYYFLNRSDIGQSLSTVFEEELSTGKRGEEEEDENIGIEVMTEDMIVEASKEADDKRRQLQHGQTVETIPCGAMYLACPGLNCYRVHAGA